MSDLEAASISVLVEEAMTSARELASEELRLALEETDAQLSSMGRALALGFVGAVLAGAGLAWGGIAIVMAFGLGAIGAASLAVGGLATAALALWLSRRSLPEVFFARTRKRMERRVSNMKEALA